MSSSTVGKKKRKYRFSWFGSPSASQSNVKEGFQIAGRFAQTLLKKLPECVDNNPVKMALSIVKIIIEIKDDVNDNKDALAEGLRKTMLMLDELAGMMAVGDSDDVKQEMGDYKMKIEDEKTKLQEATRKLESSFQNLDYENYKKNVEGICICIQEATDMFKLKMQINIRKKTDQIHDDIKKASLKDLNPSDKADYKTMINDHKLQREACTKGTRVKILKDISDWANDCSPASPRVFWLTGQAGSGKTTLAYTIAHQFETSQPTILCSNFFCSRQFPETRNLQRIIPTIAYQFSHNCRPYEVALLEQVADKSATLFHDVSNQIEELLARPWCAAKCAPNLSTYLIVIDALDEIDDTGGSTLLHDLLTTIKNNDFTGLKFLVTSRPDSAIVELIGSFPSKTVCQLQKVSIEDAQSDIKTYLDTKLPRLINSPELNTLNERSGGLFIYAATAVKIINTYDGITFEEQIEILRILLSESSNLASITQNNSPIDELYQHVLHRAFSKVPQPLLQRRLDILHTFLCAAERISPAIAATLMDTTESVATDVLAALHAVLYVQDDRVFWYHSSFPDFIFSQARSKFCLEGREYDFSCDEMVHHQRLALACFHAMELGLRFNIGDITSSFEFDGDHRDGLSKRVNKNISPPLRYSCTHWAHHLLSPPIGTTAIHNIIDDVYSSISDFLEIRVLFWIEALNLLGSQNRCTPMLHRARQWILSLKENKYSPTARDLYIAANFATRFTGSPAAESTPHLYISTLATWQDESALSLNWKRQFSGIPVFTQTKSRSDMPLMTVHIPDKRQVLAVAFSHDGARIACGLDDGSVHMMDASTGAQLNKLNGHRGPVTSIAFSINGAYIVSGSRDESLRVWDSITGRQLKELNVSINGVASVAVTSVAFSSGGTLIVSGSRDASVRLWDVPTGALLRTLNGHEASVTSVAFLKDATYIVSGSDDKSVRIWDVLTGSLMKDLRGHTSWIRSVAVSSDGKWIASGSNDKSVRVWDTSTGVEAQELKGHNDCINSVAFSRDGTQIVSASDDESVRVWEAATGAQLKELKGHSDWVNSVAFSDDGTRIVSGAHDSSVRVWDASANSQVPELKGHSVWVTSVAFSTDSSRIVSGSDDMSVQVWDVSTGAQVHELKSHTGCINSVAFSSDGAQIVSGSDDKSVRVWDVSTGLQLRDLEGHSSCVRSVAFSGDGTQIVSGSDDRSVRIWDGLTGAPLQELKGHDDWVNSVAFSKDGKWIVSGSHDTSVRIWDAFTGAQVKQLKGHSDWVNSVAFSNDGTQIVSGSDDQSVRVWDTSTGAQLRELNGHSHYVSSVAFSNDGTQIVSGSHDKAILIWDAATGAQVAKLMGHSDCVNSVAFSSDGKRIVSGSYDKSVRMWSLESRPSSWYVSDTNWVYSIQGGNPLIWVANEVHLKQLCNLLVIARQASADINFEQSMIGTDWQGCYTPHISNGDVDDLDRA